MIGILIKDSEVRAVQEFFQLFKTPWEFYIPGRRYEIVISTLDAVPKQMDTRVLIVYNSRAVEIDEQVGIVTKSTRTCDWVEWQGAAWPVYGDVATFEPTGKQFVRHRESGETVGTKIIQPGGPTIRIGLDLFSEVAFLLSQGQPPENGHVPTLDIHISLLRAIMVSAGVPFIEVPPVPAGYEFMACLTHDVDFVGIRDHKCDHTFFGFLYRASVGALLNTLIGKTTWSRSVHNWKAVGSLPLVYLGLLNDLWLEFDRYMQIEKTLGSTFFFIPFKNFAGTLGSTPAPSRRAAKYDVAKIREQVLELLRNGCEVGVHGIDAWQNSESARAELRRMREVTGQSDVGIRMHWLYWTERSPKILEEAGFAYDSTFGYNDAVGFRAGTTQPFCFLSAERLLELPLNIQDSSMFYSSRMNLSETEALNTCKGIIHSTFRSGGALTVNWHTRSLSPERLWGDFYAQLLKEIQRHRVWFATAHDIVGWFRSRRALRFDLVKIEENRASVALSGPSRHLEPSFTVRMHHPRVVSNTSGPPVYMPAHTDTRWNGEEVLAIPYGDLSGRQHLSRHRIS